VRDLNQDARAVAGIIFTSTCTSMIKIVEGSQAIPHELMRFTAFKVDDEAHPAAIVFVSWVVETLSEW
jgi:hypothetical protein